MLDYNKILLLSEILLLTILKLLFYEDIKLDSMVLFLFSNF